MGTTTVVSYLTTPNQPASVSSNGLADIANDCELERIKNKPTVACFKLKTAKTSNGLSSPFSLGLLFTYELISSQSSTFRSAGLDVFHSFLQQNEHL